MSELAGESELRPDVGLVERAVALSVGALAAATVLLLVVDRRAAVGLAAGGGILVLFVWLHLQLARRWTAAPKRRAAPIRAAALWAAKWPLAGAALWFAIARDWASPVWICAGATIVPAAVTAVAISRLSVGWRRQGGVGEARR